MTKDKEIESDEWNFIDMHTMEIVYCVIRTFLYIFLCDNLLRSGHDFSMIHVRVSLLWVYP